MCVCERESVHVRVSVCECMCAHHTTNHEDSHGGPGRKRGEAGHHGDHEFLLGDGALWEWGHAGADRSQGQGPGDLRGGTLPVSDRK